ncbi:MAG: hypothetical protein MUC87_09990 [Bacteroidia bacterium]|jgi:hypothetical protein|nr:hypothetical protein [Bacteroidia bacterium]
MKKLILILFTFLAVHAVNAQFGLPPGFDIKAFQQTEREVNWMLECDTARQLVQQADEATVQQTLICIQNTKNTGWQVYAGQLDSNGLFKQVRYTISEKGKVEKQSKPGDTTQCDAMARALWQAHKLSLKYNRPEAKQFYVHVNADLSITVNAFTVMSSASRIEYDDECNWWFSADGKRLVTSKIIRHGVNAVDPVNGIPQFIIREKMPTAGIMYNIYRFRYPSATVEYRTGISTCHFKANEGMRTWEHVAKEKKK